MYRYLGPEILSGFEGYKYSSVDTSPLSNYVMHPFWNQVVKICPRWVAPNLLTLVGFICCVGHYVMLTIYDYDFTAGVAEVPEWGSKEGVKIPGVVWVVVAVLLFLSHTLDGIDGKQARRTGTSGPIGELFDHGLDGWAAVFITCSVYHIFGRNDDHLSIPVYRMFCVLWAVHFCFMVSHWEKYNTGILYLPWGYDFSMVGGVILYLVTAVGGQKMWKFKLPGDLDPGLFIECGLYAGTVGMAIPIALYNIRNSYKDGTGKMRSFTEANRPLVSITVAIVITFLWVNLSPNNILERDPSTFFYMSGTLFANICCKLIIAQMSNTRSELLSLALLPLSIATALSLILKPSVSGELTILYVLTGVLTAGHIHYGVCVVSEMCDHFNVRPFHIKGEAEYRPVSTSRDSEDKDRLFDCQDMP